MYAFNSAAIFLPGHPYIESTTVLSDGEAHKDHHNFFSHRFNVSFAMNYDGAPKFKYSTVQVWPVHLYLNELPPIND